MRNILAIIVSVLVFLTISLGCFVGAGKFFDSMIPDKAAEMWLILTSFSMIIGVFFAIPISAKIYNFIARH